MKEKKLQVFVSSTYIDLREERQAAVEAILTAGHIPAGMELFAAGDESQMAVIERWIDESDIYLLILGGRYGSIDKKSGKSYTHLEYDYAVSKNKPLFAVVMKQTALDQRVKTLGTVAIEQENPKLLKEFRDHVTSKMVRFWEDHKDIKISILETLSELSYRKDLKGWKRVENDANVGLLAEEIAKLSSENHQLRTELDKCQNNHSTLTHYSGLTFHEMMDVLADHYVEDELGNRLNVLDVLTEQGELYLQETRQSDLPSLLVLAASTLVKFGILRSRRIRNEELAFVFTEDGHKFYIKLWA